VKVEVIVKSVEELSGLAERLLELYSGERIFALYGPMGAGKTTFVRQFCSRLGVTDEVQSPTFAIVNEYRARDAGAVYHFDFYRILKPEEAWDIGFEEYLGSGNYCFIEWPEMVHELLPPETVTVRISGEGLGDGERLVTTLPANL